MRDTKLSRYLKLAGGLLTWIFLMSGQSNPPILPGSPLPGLSSQELELFRMGLNDFKEVETAEDGLGPAFNATSCAACHNVPAIGGISLVLETRAAYRNAAGAFDALDASGNTLMHLFSVPQHTCQPVMPADVNVVARRTPIPLFGAGLVEAISDLGEGTVLTIDVKHGLPFAVEIELATSNVKARGVRA